MFALFGFEFLTSEAQFYFTTASKTYIYYYCLWCLHLEIAFTLIKFMTTFLL